MSAQVTFQSTIETLISINDSDAYVEAMPSGPVDCIFNVTADINGIFGDKYGIDSLKMPYNVENSALQPAQSVADEFTTSDMQVLRARFLPLLTSQHDLESSKAGSSTHGGTGDVTFFTQMKTQLMNLFDNMNLVTIGSNGVEGTARIGDGSVRIKDSRVVEFLSDDSVTKDTMVTKLFLAQQLAQLLEAASRDASRYIAVGETGTSGYKHVLKLREGDRLSCTVNVQAKSSTHGTEPYVNKQVWRVEFEQDSSLDHATLYQVVLGNMTQLVFTDVSHPQVFPDEQPPAYNSEGWQFTNSSPNTKINWYFSAQTQVGETLSDYTGFYTLLKVKNVLSLPFFNIYTKPKGDGTDAASWYGSRRTYVFPSNHGLSNDDDVVMYTGIDLPAVHPGVPHIQLVLDTGSSNGSSDPSQEFLFAAFASNSGAAIHTVNLIAKSFYFGVSGAHTYITLDIEPPSQDIVINTTPGYYPNELWTSVSTGVDGTGTVLWSQGETQFVNAGPLTNQVISLPINTQLYFNAWDTFGDGWNGTTFTLAHPDGTIIIDNNGQSPNNNGPLAGSFPFVISA